MGLPEPRELRLVRRLKFVFISFPSIICLYSFFTFPAPGVRLCNTWAFKEKGLHPFRNVLNSCKPPQTLIPKKQTKYPEVFFLLKFFFQEADQENITWHLRGNYSRVQKKKKKREGEEAHKVTSWLCPRRTTEEIIILNALKDQPAQRNHSFQIH